MAITRDEFGRFVGGRLEIKCLQCDKKFFIYSSRKGRKKYCSKKCYTLSMITKVYKKCLVCNKEYDIPLSIHQKGDGKYCSFSCHGKASERGEYRKCLVCKKEFYVDGWHIKNGFGKWCSQECSGIGRRKRVSRTCLNCGITFDIPINRFKDGRGKFCSRDCKNSFTDTDFRIRLRDHKMYTDWRIGVLTKDNYICQICGTKGEDLCVHHIEPFDTIIDDNKITSIEEAKKCKELWDISNGFTVCRSCHRSIHNSYDYCYY